MTKEQILQLFADNELSAAMKGLDLMSGSDLAWILYMKGRIAWKSGRKSDAISYYEQAVALDPHSEAATALEQAREVMAFYNKDLYNP